MTVKTRKTKKAHNKSSKRVLEMQEDSTSVWGKNKPLEKFWRGLASSKYVVVIYKNGKHKYIKLPNSKKAIKVYNDFDENKEIEAVLSSNLSQDAYEEYLYPKAKDNSVEYVIQNYKKYFKPMAPIKDVQEGTPLMKKVLFPS
jgi:hypothetical protein